MTQQSQPNFLFIMSDQLRPDRTGFGGNPIVKTPNLDALAANGRSFNRAYCVSPSCGPSRNSIFTGRMPSANGSWTNALSLQWDANLPDRCTQFQMLLGLTSMPVSAHNMVAAISKGYKDG